MRSYLNKLNKSLLKTIHKIGEVADRKRFKAYLVGGVVRDIILGRKNLDLDIVVEGNALELGAIAAKDIKARLVKYEQFKTASLYPSSPRYFREGLRRISPVGLNLPSGRIDLATARSESYAHSGALPVVKEGHLKDDLLRRDFTINALAICINQDSFGQLVDPFHGLDDLKKGSIRVLHEKSFQDDPTRILRAVRFEQRFGFELEKNTLRLLKEALRKNVSQNVKPPRYFAEFKKILKEEEPLKSIQRLDQLGALKFIDSRLKVDYNILRKVERNLFHFGSGRGEQWLLYGMALVKSLPEARLAKRLDQFHFKTEDKQAVLASLRLKELIRKLSGLKLLPSDVYKILEPLPLSTVFYLYLLADKKVLGPVKRFLTKDRHVRLAINGHDLKQLGFSSGEEMGKALEHILYEKMDGKVSSQQEELELARQLLEVI